MSAFVFQLILCLQLTYVLAVERADDFAFQKKWTGLCKAGKKQSPIAIPCKKARSKVDSISVEFINFNVPITKPTLANLGNLAKLSWTKDVKRYAIFTSPSPLNSIEQKTRYVLDNLHMHFGHKAHDGTSHTVNGTHLALELHIFLTKPEFEQNTSAAYLTSGNIIEFVVLHKLSRKGNQVWDEISQMAKKTIEEGQSTTSDATTVTIDKFIPLNSTFSAYSGSTLVSGCVEAGINFVVFDQAMPISASQTSFRDWFYISNGSRRPFLSNNRPLQKRYSRKVYMGRAQKITSVRE